ncbi:hypothetical protein GGR52DRAFT_549433 [Hypoxylon sp. FL1284]|nr:hypothetical protein GGR52DRAFT_549433 [Hypoxylon sp. FL1284]
MANVVFTIATSSHSEAGQPTMPQVIQGAPESNQLDGRTEATSSNTEGQQSSDERRNTISSQHPSSSEIALSKSIATTVIRGLKSQDLDTRVPEAWRDLEGNMSQLEMADALWAKSSVGNVKTIRWVNRFYSACMRSMLRRRGHLPHGARREWTKDRAATSAHIINMAVNALGEAGYNHGYRIYNGLAVRNQGLSMNVKKERQSIISSLLAQSLQEIDELEGDLLCWPAAVISTSWKEPFDAVCVELGLHNLLRYRTLENFQSIFNVPRTTSQHRDSIMDLVNLNQLHFPAISDKLRRHIMNIKLGNIGAQNKKRFSLKECRKMQHPPEIYEVFYWPQKLQVLVKAIAKEVNPAVQASFPEKLVWRSALVLIEKGGIFAKERTHMSLVVPIKISGPSNAQVQFDRGDETDPMEKRDWSALPPVAMEGEITIRKVDHPIAFIWIRWYGWNKHGDWLKKQPYLNKAGAKTYKA